MNFGADRETIELLKNAGRLRRLPFHISRIDYPAVAALYEKNLVLVRPDGHVAWRGNELGTLDPEAIMDRVRGI